MAKLGDIAKKIRSKNAGPFWLTIDIFCNTPKDYETICSNLETRAIGDVFAKDPSELKRYDIAELNVIKFSLPRPFIQGSVNDPDMHGASWAALIAQIDIAT